MRNNDSPENDGLATRFSEAVVRMLLGAIRTRGFTLWEGILLASDAQHVEEDLPKGMASDRRQMIDDERMIRVRIWISQARLKENSNSKAANVNRVPSFLSTKIRF
jgi:hypothetical protein